VIREASRKELAPTHSRDPGNTVGGDLADADGSSIGHPFA